MTSPEYPKDGRKLEVHQLDSPFPAFPQDSIVVAHSISKVLMLKRKEPILLQIGRKKFPIQISALSPEDVFPVAKFFAPLSQGGYTIDNRDLGDENDPEGKIREAKLNDLLERRQLIPNVKLRLAIEGDKEELFLRKMVSQHENYRSAITIHRDAMNIIKNIYCVVSVPGGKPPVMISKVTEDIFSGVSFRDYFIPDTGALQVPDAYLKIAQENPFFIFAHEGLEIALPTSTAGEQLKKLLKDISIEFIRDPLLHSAKK